MSSFGQLFFDTARLRARRFAPDDVEPFVRYRSDPDVARYQSWSDYTLDQGRALVEQMRSAEPGVPGEWFQIALEERAGGELVGDVALCVDADEPRQAEIGVTLAAAHQGRGYAAEALPAYLDWLFATFALHRVIAVTDVENAPVNALLERVGMRREAHHVENVFFKGAWGSEYVHAVLAREWRDRSRSTSGGGPAR